MNTELLNTLQVIFVRVPGLVDKHESRQPDFPMAVKKWLLDAEKVLNRFNKPQVSELAVLRGNIINAGRGIYPSASDKKKTSRHKAEIIAAFEAMIHGQEILQIIYKSAENKVNEATTWIRQVLALAHQEGFLIEWESTEDALKSPVTLWQFLSTKKELRSGLDRALVYISYPEALIMLESNYRECPGNGVIG